MRMRLLLMGGYNMQDTMPIKSVMQIRLPLHLRNKFNEIAKKNNKIPSKLIRDFMRDYIKENSGEDAKQG